MPRKKSVPKTQPAKIQEDDFFDFDDPIFEDINSHDEDSDYELYRARKIVSSGFKAGIAVADLVFDLIEAFNPPRRRKRRRY